MCGDRFTILCQLWWSYFLRTLPHIHYLLEPPESAISRVLIPAITDRQCGQLARDILAIPIHLGRLDVANTSSDANLDYISSVKVTAPLFEQIEQIRPIISAHSTYFYETAKALAKYLAPLSENQLTIKNTLDFTEKLKDRTINEHEIVVSYDVTSLFTEIPLDETINHILDQIYKQHRLP